MPQQEPQCHLWGAQPRLWLPAERQLLCCRPAVVLERAAQAPEQLSRWQAMLVPAAAHTYWQAMLVLVLVRVAATVPGAQATAPAMAQMSVRRLGKAHVQLLN